MNAKWFSSKEVEMLLTSIAEEDFASGIENGHVKHDAEVSEVMSELAEDYYPGTAVWR